MSEAKLGLKVKLEGIAKLKEQLHAVKSGFDNIKKSIFSLKGAAVGIFAGIGLYKLNELLANSSKLAADEQQQMMQLRAVMISMHRNVKGFTDSMIKLADAQELATGYGNEQIMSAEHMLATFSTISNKAMPEVLKTTEDLARGWGIDLTQAARIMGIASMGLTGELTRYGITLSDEAKKTKDFRLILRDIQEQVSGSAEAFRYSSNGIRQTFYSILDDSKKIFGHLLNNVIDPFYEVATEKLVEFNEKFKSMKDNQRIIKYLQNVIIAFAKNVVHSFVWLYNAVVDVNKAFIGLKFTLQGLAYVEDTLMGIFSKTYAKRAKEFAKSVDDTANSYMRLKHISYTGIDKVFAKMPEWVDKADKKISSARESLKKTIPVAKVLTTTIEGEANAAKKVSEISKRIRNEIQKQEDSIREVSDRIIELTKSPFEYFKTKLNEQIAAYRKAGVSEVLLTKLKYAEIKNYIKEHKKDVKEGLDMFAETAKEVARSATDAFSSFFFDAMQGKLKTFGDYLKSFATAVEHVLASILAQQFVTSVFGAGGLNILPKANGGILKGGFQAFASGGIVTQPTLGLVGEGRYNEAVVPLPDGKSIPVKGAATNIQVNINNQTGQPVKGEQGKVQFDGEQYIVNVILKNYEENGSIRRLIAGGAY